MTSDAPPPSEGSELQAPAHDRGVSPIAGRFGGRQGRVITLAALAVGCGVFLFATWDRGDARDRDTPRDDTPPRQMSPFEPARRAEPPLLEERRSRSVRAVAHGGRRDHPGDRPGGRRLLFVRADGGRPAPRARRKRPTRARPRL